MTWSSASIPASSSFSIGLGHPGTVVATPSGTPPFTARLYGGCATLSSVEDVFTLNVQTGICTLVVKDGTGRAIGIGVDGAPPRTFLVVSTTVAQSPSAITHLAVGERDRVSVDERFGGNIVNAPFTSTVVGDCVDVTPATLAEPGTFEVHATQPGICVVVVSDSAGQSIPLNVSTNV